MKLLETPAIDHRTDTVEPPQNPQALFEEARRRRRRRWIFVGAAAVLVFALAGTLLVVSRGGPPPASTIKGPARTSHPTLTTPSSPSTSPDLPSLNRPEALAVTPGGAVLVSNQGTNQILEIGANGTISVFAGNGQSGYGGDGGLASQAELNDPLGLAVTADGTTFIADHGNNAIRAIAPNGIISTITKVSDPLALAVGPTGVIYVVNSSTLYSISPSGTVTTLAQGSVTLANASPGPLIGPDNSTYLWPSAIAATPSGDLYIADFGLKSLIEDSNGAFQIVGQPAAPQQTYVTQAGLAAASDGSVVVADYGGFSIDRADGTSLTRIVSFGLNTVSGIGGVVRPSGVAIGPNGEIYADTDGVNGGANRPAIVAIDPDGKVHLLAVGPVTTMPGAP
jgi:sugar lactone lactonase YvrE